MTPFFRGGRRWAGALLCLPLAVGCAPGPAAPTTEAQVLGDVHTGQYHLGPVDFAETEWHNACAPSGGYATSLRDATGLGGGVPGRGEHRARSRRGPL